MSVDIDGRKNGQHEAPVPEAKRAFGRTKRRTSALRRMAGPIPEGTRVGQLLDRFLAQVHSSLGHATGWTLTEEQAAKQREEAARRAEEARQAALAEAEKARAAAEAARRAAEAEAAQARLLERRSTERLVKLEASLRAAEERASEAEKRASTAPPEPRRLLAGPTARLALSALAVAVLSFAALLVWQGTGQDSSPPHAPAKAVAPPTDEMPRPEPLVESIPPTESAEPSITTIEEERDAEQGAQRRRNRPQPTFPHTGSSDGD
jgi:dTMP kinase